MVGVILFRAQPFHNGHLYMVKTAFNDCMKNNCDLYIFIGSADKFGTVRNPIPISFRYELVKGSLQETFSEQELKHIHIYPLNDLNDETCNDYNWGRYFFMKVFALTKDSNMSIYYSGDPNVLLSWFDEEERWCLNFIFVDRFDGITATQVRNIITTPNMSSNALLSLVPNYVYNHREEIKKYILKSMERK